MDARRDIEFIPDRLNEEPVVFLSMTNSEIKLSLMIFFAIWTPICLMVGWIIGKALLSLACVAGMVFLSMWLAGKRLRVIKRGKPKRNRDHINKRHYRNYRKKPAVRHGGARPNTSRPTFRHCQSSTELPFSLR